MYKRQPWAGPIGCLEVGYVDGQIVLNPTNEQKHASQLDLTVAATDKKVIMIEAGAKELPDDIMYDAIVAAHEDIKKQVAFINQIVAEIGRDKMTYDHADFDQDVYKRQFTNCGGINYAIDLNLVAVQDAVISITNTRFEGNCGASGPIKVEMCIRDRPDRGWSPERLAVPGRRDPLLYRRGHRRRDGGRPGVPDRHLRQPVLLR